MSAHLKAAAELSGELEERLRESIGTAGRPAGSVRPAGRGHILCVQTFLPYADFRRTARVLDPKRLGNQRTEALVILRVIRIPTYGWQHHPAVNMWRGHEDALIAYGLEICDEWVRRGHADTVRDKLEEHAAELPAPRQAELRAAGRLPPWLGTPRLHRSHRSALIRKLPAWYGPRFPEVPDDLPYWWPVRAAPR